MLFIGEPSFATFSPSGDDPALTLLTFVLVELVVDVDASEACLRVRFLGGVDGVENEIDDREYAVRDDDGDGGDARSTATECC